MRSSSLVNDPSSRCAAIRVRLAVGRSYVTSSASPFSIEKLRIEDANHPANYRGPTIFANFNRRYTDGSYVEEYPYVKTREVVLKDVKIASGKPLRVSDNPFMFRKVVVKTHGGK